MSDREQRNFTTLRRDDMWAQGTKSLLLVNGGAIIALLAFLQAIWTDAPKLVPWIVSGVVPLVIGVALAATILLLRAETVLFWSDVDGRGKLMMRLYRWFAAISMAMFLCGVLILVWGVFQNLPEKLGNTSI